jgi:hypothetical protein
MPMMKGPTILRAAIRAHSLWPCNRLLTDHQLREAGEEEASVEEGSAINPGSYSAFSVVRTRVTQQGRAKSRPEIERNCRSQSKAEPAEAGPPYCFVLLSVHPRVRRQPTAYDFSCFDKSFLSFLVSISTTTTVGSQSAARRAPSCSATARPLGGVQSSHSQHHCT